MNRAAAPAWIVVNDRGELTDGDQLSLAGVRARR
jgi:hypothetical protein